MPLRLETEAEMKMLSDMRGGRLLDKERELNRTDDVLDEVLQMLSLCFLSLGKKRESELLYTITKAGCHTDIALFSGPAVYSQVVAIKVCLNKECIARISSQLAVHLAHF